MLQPLQNNLPKAGELGYQVLQAPCAKSASINSASRTFAYKGEPTYDKEMDLDNDGVITFDEFNQYCEDNNISDSEKQSMLENRVHWQTFKQSLTYAEKGDLRYDENMDTNKDNRISYDEYMEYTRTKREENEQNASSAASSQDETKENNLIKKLAQYSESTEEESNIEVEA